MNLSSALSRPFSRKSLIFFAGMIVPISSHCMAQARTAKAISKGSVLAQTERHIHAVENGLIPAQVIAGRPLPALSLQARMAFMHIPGVSITLIHDGKIEWSRGYGVLAKGGKKVTPDTLFQAGSVSKAVTAMAVLRGVQGGQWTLDTNINEYLKSWHVPENNFTQGNPLTIRELLSHTGGTSVHGFAGYQAGTPAPTLHQVLDGESPANNKPIRVVSATGSHWEYSGGGYTILQQMLIDQEGKPFPALMHDDVLAPVGMSVSTFDEPLPEERKQDAATPYDADGSPIAGGAHTYPEMAAAGLWTSSKDLAKYAIQIQHSLAGAPDALISPKLMKEALTEVKGGWGMGFTVAGSPAKPYFYHGGDDAGFKAIMMAYNEGDGVVVMTSGDHGVILWQDIVRAVAREYNWPDYKPVEHKLGKADPQSYDKYVGHYTSSTNLPVIIDQQGDRLFFTMPKVIERTEMFPESPNQFFILDDTLDFVFSFDASGKAVSADIDTTHRHISMKRDQ